MGSFAALVVSGPNGAIQVSSAGAFSGSAFRTVSELAGRLVGGRLEDYGRFPAPLLACCIDASWVWYPP